MLKRATIIDRAEADVLVFKTFLAECRAKLYSTNLLERFNGEIKRRTDVVGIIPSETTITQLVGAIVLEQDDEWAVQRPYMNLGTFAPMSNAAAVSLPTAARRFDRTNNDGDTRAIRAHRSGRAGG